MFRSLLFSRRRALCPCFVSSLFLLNLERHEKSSKLRQRLEQKKEKKKDEGNIIIIKTDRLSLALFCRTEMETLFQLEWPEGKEGKGKKKRVFWGEQRVIFHRKKSDLTRDALSPLLLSLRVLKTCRAGKRKREIPDELLAIVAYHLALLEATWFVSLLLLLTARR